MPGSAGTPRSGAPRAGRQAPGPSGPCWFGEGSWRGADEETEHRDGFGKGVEEEEPADQNEKQGEDPAGEGGAGKEGGHRRTGRPEEGPVIRADREAGAVINPPEGEIPGRPMPEAAEGE